MLTTAKSVARESHPVHLNQIGGDCDGSAMHPEGLVLISNQRRHFGKRLRYYRAMTESKADGRAREAP